MTKKLIEVALPLDLINDESAYDKMPGIGPHPKGLHHWWARLPLPAARAVLFASLVDDPSSHPDRFPTEEAQHTERERLFGLLRGLLQKKIHTKPQAYRDALEEIKRHCGGQLPTVHDPFSGGGSIPLEGMRLGLPVIAADLNPVAVLINKAMLEILPRFANHPPLNPESRKRYHDDHPWTNARGLAEDMRYYGEKINEKVKERIGHLYPTVKVQLPNGDEKEVNVLTWIWARTVKCPNPACGCEMPLVKTFALKTKEPKVAFRPIVKRANGFNEITGYEVFEGEPERKGTVTKKGAECIACHEPVSLKYLRSEGQAKRVGTRLVCFVTEAPKVSGKGKGVGRGKLYFAGNEYQESIAKSAQPTWYPDFALATHPQYMAAPRYGLSDFKDLFTSRQLLALNSYSEAILETCQQIEVASNPEYAAALATFFFFAIDRLADFNCSLSTWKSSGEQQMHLFGRGAIPIAWDFTEANITGNKAICWLNAVGITVESIETVLNSNSKVYPVIQKNAESLDERLQNLLVSTDPPYYNNIPYADVSDFFYVWLKKNLASYYPDLLKTMLVPKQEELVANELRFEGDKLKAKTHFETGYTRVFSNLKEKLDKRFPLTIYYAFKQEEDEEDVSDSELDDSLLEVNLTTGWETMLEAVVASGYQITATWPIRASQKWRLRSMGSNALASYIVMACRPRPEKPEVIPKARFLQLLRRELMDELHLLQQANLAPVDLAQAAIGPGMGVYSRYGRILEQDGSAMRVRTALQLINRTVDELLTEQEAEFDAETRWAIDWYSQHGHADGPYGDADALSRAKNTAVSGLAEAGIVRSGGGLVRLPRRDELSPAWNPDGDRRVVLWEIAQHLIKRLQEGGETGAAQLYKRLGPRAEPARELAYRLFTICEKRGWAADALAYNSLVLSWQDIVARALHVDLTDGHGQYGLGFN